MKKILALALGMLLIPFTAFGMEAMDDTSMDSVTGQSGVAITVDNIGIYSSGEYTWYSGGDANAWVGISAGDEIMTVNAADSAQIQGIVAEFTGTIENSGDTLADAYVAASPLMIKTQDELQGFADAGVADVTGVEITLGTLDIQNFTAEDSYTEFGVFSGSNPESTFDETYGRIKSTNGRTVVLGGQIFIAPAENFD